MPTDLVQLENLYHRLGYRVEPTPGRMVVKKMSVGFPESHYFYTLSHPDVESALELCVALESSAIPMDHAVVICEEPCPPDVRVLLSDYCMGVFDLDGWLNEIIRGEELSKTALEVNYGYTDQFVTPNMEPITYHDVESWASGDDSALDTAGHIVLLLGPAGFGKTTVAKHIASCCAKKHLEDPARPIPVLIRLEEFRAERRWDDLLASYSRSMGVPEITPQALQFLIDRNRVFVIVDGLDELAERGGTSAATEALRQVTQITERGHLLVTARESYLPSFKRVLKMDDFSLVRVRGVMPDQRSALISSFASEVRRKVEVILGRLESDDTDLSTNPLLVVLLAKAIKESMNGGTGSELDTRSETERPMRLVSNVFDLIHKREAHRQNLELSVNDLRGLFGDLAFEALGAGRASAGEDNLLIPDAVDFLRLWVEDRTRPLGDDRDPFELGKLRLRWTDALKSHHFLRLYGDSASGDDVLGFAHAFFRDVAAAMALYDRIQSGDDVPSPRVCGDAVVRYCTSMLREEPWTRDLDAIGVPTSHLPFLIEAAVVSRHGDGDAHGNEPISHQAIRDEWRALPLDGLLIRGVSFDSVDFAKATTTGTVFERCVFRDCDLSKASMAGAEYISCRADLHTLNQLRSQGVSSLPAQLSEDGSAVARSVSAEVTMELVRAFFKKFIRGEPGQHKRSVRSSAFVRGQDSERGVFTTKHLMPLMEKADVMQHVPAIDVFRFNSDFQSVGDSVLFDDKVPDGFKAVFEELESLVVRYLV